MRCTLTSKGIKHVSRAIVTFSKFNNEVRVLSTENSLRFEAIKGEHAFGQVILNMEHFDSWDPSSPADVYFKSKSLKVIFRNHNSLAKNLQKMEIWIENDQNLAVFRFQPRNYQDKVIKLPIMTIVQTTNVPTPDYESYAVHIETDAKTWIGGLKLFPNSIDLVTSRFRFRHIKMETGDERELAQIMTKFYFHLAEFKIAQIKEETICTYALRPVMDFLHIWDPSSHIVDSYFDPRHGVPVVFMVKDSTYEAKLILAKVSKQHEADSPPGSDDDEARTLPNISCSRASLTSNIQPGTSRPDPRNRFIYRSDPSVTPIRPPPPPSIPMSTGFSTVPRSTAPSMASFSVANSNVLASEGAEDEFDDDDFDNLPTQTLTQIGKQVSAGEEEFETSDDDLDAINESVRAFSQGISNQNPFDSNGNISGDESFGAPVHQSTQAPAVEQEASLGGSNSANNKLNESIYQQQRRFLGLDETEQEPSQEYEILAGDSDGEY